MNHLCNSTQCIARKSCTTYRLDVDAERINLDSGDGLRCIHRVDVNNYSPVELKDWRDVDLLILKLEEITI